MRAGAFRVPAARSDAGLCVLLVLCAFWAQFYGTLTQLDRRMSTFPTRHGNKDVPFRHFGGGVSSLPALPANEVVPLFIMLSVAIGDGPSALPDDQERRHVQLVAEFFLGMCRLNHQGGLTTGGATDLETNIRKMLHEASTVFQPKAYPVPSEGESDSQSDSDSARERDSAGESAGAGASARAQASGTGTGAGRGRGRGRGRGSGSGSGKGTGPGRGGGTRKKRKGKGKAQEQAPTMVPTSFLVRPVSSARIFTLCCAFLGRYWSSVPRQFATAAAGKLTTSGRSEYFA